VLEQALQHHRATGNVRGEADALAARGLVACLEASVDGTSFDQGHRSLEVAHALHRGAGDTLRRAKVVDMARLVGLDLNTERTESAETGSTAERARLLRASAAGHRAAGRLWREALDLFRLAELEDGELARRELLDAARRAADEAGVPAELTSALAGPHAAISVGLRAGAPLALGLAGLGIALALYHPYRCPPPAPISINQFLATTVVVVWAGSGWQS
jgi:hypothetical protein